MIATIFLGAFYDISNNLNIILQKLNITSIYQYAFFCITVDSRASCKINNKKF